MPTILDQFTVKVGLDASQFKKGLEEVNKSAEAAKRSLGSGAGGGGGVATSMDMIAAGAKRATGSLGVMGSALGKGGAVALALGALITLAKSVDDKLFNVATRLRQVGIESKNLGQSAAEFRNLQNASEMAGGSVDDATQSVDDLQRSLFNLRFNGQVSESLVMLQRLGVQFQDSYGRARNFRDILVDTAAALEQAVTSGEMTRPEAAQYALQAGFGGGMQQLVLQGPDAVRAELAKQEARNQVSEKAVSRATRWARASTSKEQMWEAEIGVRTVELTGAARAAATEKLEQGGEKAGDLLGQSFFGLSAAADMASASLNYLASKDFKIPELLRSEPKSAADWSKLSVSERKAKLAPFIKQAASRNLVREDVLDAIIRQESQYNPGAVSSTGAKGVAQFMPGVAQGMGFTPGQSPEVDIDKAAKLLRSNYDRAIAAGYGDDDDSLAWVAAVSAYHNGFKGMHTGGNVGDASRAYPSSVLSSIPDLSGAAKSFQFPGASNVQTEVQIDAVNVYTQATDADGIAADMSNTLRRKLLATHAEGGVN